MIFHVSNLNIRVLARLTHPLASIWRKLCEDSICKLLLKQTSQVFLILKLSHALDVLFSVLSRLHGRKHTCTFCWMKDNWIWLPSDIVASDFLWHGTHELFSGIGAVTTTFHVFHCTYFLNFRLSLLIVLRFLVHLIYLVSFNNFLVFNFPFLISNNNFLFPG